VRSRERERERKLGGGGAETFSNFEGSQTVASLLVEVCFREGKALGSEKVKVLG
jgi:hypothetical protein